MKKEHEAGLLPGFLDQFAGKKICVVGDIIADVYIFGKPYRLSREAPVVVVKYEESKIYPGSAGNTINNLAAMGAEVYPSVSSGAIRSGGSSWIFSLPQRISTPPALYAIPAKQ